MAASAWQHEMPIIIHFLQLQSWVSRLTAYLSPTTERCETSNTFPPAELHQNSYTHIRFYINTEMVIHQQHINKSYLGIQYLVFLDSSCSLVFILGQICPSIFSTFSLLDCHLFILYICMSSNIEITGLLLASTRILLNTFVMLFTIVQ